MQSDFILNMPAYAQVFSLLWLTGHGSPCGFVAEDRWKSELKDFDKQQRKVALHHVLIVHHQTYVLLSTEEKVINSYEFHYLALYIPGCPDFHQQHLK